MIESYQRSFEYKSARGGGRTRTSLAAHKILSLACIPISPPGQWKKKPSPAGWLSRAEDEIRTRDPHLGKVMLYQLSYFRIIHIRGCVGKNFLFRWECKGKASQSNLQKIQPKIICISACTGCFPVLPLWAFRDSACYTIHNIHRARKRQMQKVEHERGNASWKPSYVRNPSWRPAVIVPAT